MSKEELTELEVIQAVSVALQKQVQSLEAEVARLKRFEGVLNCGSGIVFRTFCKKAGIVFDGKGFKKDGWDTERIHGIRGGCEFTLDYLRNRASEGGEKGRE